MGLAESNKKAYDLTAREYSERRSIHEKNNKQITSRFLGLLMERFPGRKPSDLSVLDVGVGSGLDLQIFSEKGLKTYGIDISSEMIEVAKQVSPESVYYCGNFLERDFKQQKFSAVYAQAFIHLFPKETARKVLEKMLSLLEPEGLIHFSTTVHEKGLEGLEEKKDYQAKVKRYRKRWELPELNSFLKEIPGTELLLQYQIIGPLGKHWVNTVLGQKE